MREAEAGVKDTGRRLTTKKKTLAIIRSLDSVGSAMENLERILREKRHDSRFNQVTNFLGYLILK